MKHCTCGDDLFPGRLDCGDGRCLAYPARLEAVPCTIRRAKELVAKWHRHSRPPHGALFAVSCSTALEREECGVAVVGRPVSRHLDDGYTAEVTRLATNGQKNACSFLYGACKRAARALGYRRLITYTLAAENGASLRASGFTQEAETAGGEWSRTTRPRKAAVNACRKRRWAVSL